MRQGLVDTFLSTGLQAQSYNMTEINYSEYKLWEREQIFQHLHKDLPEPQYAIIWEDPAEPDAITEDQVYA